METKLREVKIEEYWPLIVKNTAEFGQIAVAENPEFNNLAECIYRVLCDSFIDADMTEYGVSRWEKMLGITPAEGSSLDDRKAAILTQLSVKIPYTVRVLRQMLVGLLGEDNFTMKLNNDTATLTVAVSLDTTEAQIAEVESLLDRVLPRNLVTEMEWIDGLPIDYTHVAYLENVIGDNSESASILTDIYPTQNTRGRMVGEAVKSPYVITCCAFGCNARVDDPVPPFTSYWWYRSYNGGNDVGFAMNGKNVGKASYMSAGIHTLEFGKDGLRVDGVLKGTPKEIGEFKSPRPLMFLSETPIYKWARCFRGKAYSFQLWENDIPILNFVPALDPTGAPCFFDTVTKKPYVTATGWDFTVGIDTQQQLDNFISSLPNYNGQAVEQLQLNLAEALQTPENEARLAEAMAKNAASPAMIPLDMEYIAPKFYAKLTEHGIRRLYHVPKGYTGTMDEYAAANGFKELVEPPMPLEGYWMPEWREIETQLILDWIETEPPTEEVTENE